MVELAAQEPTVAAAATTETPDVAAVASPASPKTQKRRPRRTRRPKKPEATADGPVTEGVTEETATATAAKAAAKKRRRKRKPKPSTSAAETEKEVTAAETKPSPRRRANRKKVPAVQPTDGAEPTVAKKRAPRRPRDPESDNSPVTEDLSGKRCFGSFECLECPRKWSSGNAWKDKGQQCSECKKMLLSHYLRPLRRRRGPRRPTLIPEQVENNAEVAAEEPATEAANADKRKTGKPHPIELCQMCQELGRNCQQLQEKVETKSEATTEATVESPNSEINASELRKPEIIKSETTEAPTEATTDVASEVTPSETATQAEIVA